MKKESRRFKHPLSVEITTYCHATEDPEKVKAALKELLPLEIREEADKIILEESYKGHFGNPIKILKIKIEKKKAEKVFKHLLKLMKKEDLEYFSVTLDGHVDHNMNVYIRLDKQSVFLGSPRILDSDDVIKIKIKFSKLASREDIFALINKALGEKSISTK